MNDPRGRDELLTLGVRSAPVLGRGDKSCRRKVKAFYGTPPMHELFERFNIEPDGRLSAEDLAGLPLPEGLWE